MKFLLPTDGSSYSEAAAKFLLRLNLSAQDEIRILHVISDEPMQDQDDFYSRRIREMKQLIAPSILGSTKHFLETTPAKIDTSIEVGCPDSRIIEAAIQEQADLIVMGPKRVKGIQSHIVGSVTKSVSINSPKPILVIKPSPDEIPGKMKILFATNGSENARRTAEVLSSIPFHDAASITVLHVITPVFYDVPEHYVSSVNAGMKDALLSLKDREMRQADEVISQASNYLKRRFTQVDSLLREGDPTDEILQTASELRPDIIALGSKGMGGFRGLIGSISRYILSVAECSVLIGKI